jgi:hypothetical protein
MEREALKKIHQLLLTEPHAPTVCEKLEAIVREALAQPVQEPVAWAVVGDGKFGKYEIGRETETGLDVSGYWANRGYSLVPLYTTPPKRKWVGLTGEEIQATHDTYHKRMGPMEYAQAIEAKLKEKNT